MKFKTTKEIFFSILYDDSLDTKLLAAAAADCFKDKIFFLISNSSAIIENVVAFLRSDFNIQCNVILLDRKWLLDTVPFFIYDIFEIQNNITQINLEDKLSQKKIIPSNEVIKTAISKLISGELVDANTISNPIIRNKISNDIKVLIAARECIIKYFIGASAFYPSVNISKRKKTDFEGLKLEEYITSLQDIKKLSNNNSFKINQYLNNKLATLGRYLPVVPQSPNDIIDKTRPSNSLHDGFPTIYKLLSCFQYKSALLSIEYKNPNSAFLHSIRTLETYIEGFLIYANIATISDFYNKNALLEKDAFLIKNKKVSGFGKKYASAGDVNNIKSHKFYNNIREMIDLRNKLYLTHGDMKACSILTRRSLNYIMAIINHIDLVSNQKSVPWCKIYRDIDKSLRFDFFGVTKSSLSNLFIHKVDFQLHRD